MRVHASTTSCVLQIDQASLTPQGQGHNAGASPSAARPGAAAPTRQAGAKDAGKPNGNSGPVDRASLRPVTAEEIRELQDFLPMRQGEDLDEYLASYGLRRVSLSIPDDAIRAADVDGDRTWTDNTGKYQTVGTLVSVDRETVTIRKPNGKMIVVPVKRLSVWDQRKVEVVRILQTFFKWKGAQELWDKATKANRNKKLAVNIALGRPTSSNPYLGTASNWQEGFTWIAGGVSPEKGAQLLVFELCNVSHAGEWEALDRKAQNGDLSKEDFVTGAERIEYPGTWEAQRACSEAGWGEQVFDPLLYPPGLPFEQWRKESEHNPSQIQHRQTIRDAYDNPEWAATRELVKRNREREEAIREGRPIPPPPDWPSEMGRPNE